jgi:hypothetical protein
MSRQNHRGDHDDPRAQTKGADEHEDLPKKRSPVEPRREPDGKQPKTTQPQHAQPLHMRGSARQTLSDIVTPPVEAKTGQYERSYD